ncbi:DNA-deoxyinosine glycosylase [Caulobacter flavus]|uniref:DNA-deoxyinosine glycosylase n=1 Tax=Caulobacter flavus TaxID=1679497 RepID=A0A2N5CVF9_9CAUL|nr:DNA-deoxyinosine glycosylase [Caulobacter flavus]AYV46885.1 DNA-deoxyinosine glycosylase [Caulobacter flavus]PLR17793.1 DNA-deoxyinosine glycosylase [Caulobacter flavus]
MSQDGRKRGFPPVVDPDVRVLVLGSLPGDASLAAAQYYGHPRNGFWRLIGAVVGRDLAALPYEQRLSALLAAGVGLWDVHAEAVRPGSLDAAIKDAADNDLTGLVDGLPRLRAVAFNGGAAAKAGTRLLASRADRLALVSLPSSSPAHAAMSFEAKREAWLALRDRL